MVITRSMNCIVIGCCIMRRFFNELANDGEIRVVKSRKHHDGEECFGGGWFIVMAELPTGQISNHYELKYWEYFKCEEVDVAPEWDGHTPEDAAHRLEGFIAGYQIGGLSNDCTGID